MKISSTPFGSMFSSMTIKNSKKSLTPNGVKVNYKRVRIFHRPPASFVIRYTE